MIRNELAEHASLVAVMARVVPHPAEWPAPQARLLLGGSLKGNPEGLWARVKGGFCPPCISGWIKFSSGAKLWHWRDTDAPSNYPSGHGSISLGAEGADSLFMSEGKFVI